jgi:hypothetical protein
MVNRSTVGRWVKSVMASETTRGDLPHSGCSVTAVRPWCVRFDASQTNKWYSFFKSVKEVLVTSFKILDI